MKKVIAIMILLVIVLTLFSPLRIYADVVVNDTSEDILNENQITIGRKLATLDILENLLSNGVSSFSISNVSNIDTYLDNLWNEIDTAYEDGSLTTEIVGNVIDWNGLSKLHYEIEKNTLNYATQLNSAGLLLSGVNLLSDYFLNNDFKAPKKDIPVALAGMQFLSALNNTPPAPAPDPDYSYISNINTIYLRNYLLDETYLSVKFGSSYYYFTKGNYKKQTFVSSNFNSYRQSNERNDFPVFSGLNGISTIQIYHNNGSNVSVTYSVTQPFQGTLRSQEGYRYAGFTPSSVSSGYIQAQNMWNDSNLNVYIYNQSSFNTLSSALSYIYQHYTNVNLYVNDAPWILIDNVVTSSPTLDIDGLLKLFGQNQPVEYYYPNDISIDYKKLYEVIVNAIRDSLPVTMQDITNNNTYIDSHDTTYSPTIYNYYGDDSEQEQDYIETLINSATVPNFNQTYLIPLTEPLDSGIHTFYTSVSVIPEEILIIFGGLFVLLLFVCILNRMLE